MDLMVRALLVFAAAGTLALPATPPDSSRHRAAPAVQHFASDQLEAYLDQTTLDYIRPGLVIKVNSVTIGADRKPVVDLTMTDALQQPLDRTGGQTPGAVSASFVLSWFDPTTRNYTSYITRTETAPANAPLPGNKAVQATADSGGTWTALDAGHYTYKFGNALPANFDPTKTHTLGIYSTRALSSIVGKDYYANAEFDFRPDGAALTDVWDEIRTANCNQCHDPLMAHGGSRQDVKLCVLCHSPQSSDAETGNTVDFKVMIHKIHMGADLPSVQAGQPYQIWGFNNSVNDFSTVVFPQDIRNCGPSCHEGKTPANMPAQGYAWYTFPSRAACGSCHDDVNFATGAGHPGGPQASDAACSKCHIPVSGQEYDASIQGAHTVPYKSTQLHGLVATIVSVTNTKPGQHPTAVFAVKNGDGTPVDATKLATFAPILGGPTTSYSTAIRESGVASSKTPATYDPATGLTTYTFQAAIPANATGSWTVSADIYRNVNLKEADGDPDIAVREAAFNPIKYVAVTDPAPVPRRQVVATQQCDQCHDRLAAHGDQRQNTEECVICHNPTADDSAQRPASANPPESISFQRLIHRIHTGENLTQDFTIYGFNHSVNNFNDVRYPGDLRDCAKCHTGTTYTLPLAAGIQPVTTLRDYFTPQGPATAACLGCHDSQAAAAHAYLNTTNFGNPNGPLAEACATCHGTGAQWDVAVVHAR